MTLPDLYALAGISPEVSVSDLYDMVDAIIIADWQKPVVAQQQEVRPHRRPRPVRVRQDPPPDAFDFLCIVEKWFVSVHGAPPFEEEGEEIGVYPLCFILWYRANAPAKDRTFTVEPVQ